MLHSSRTNAALFNNSFAPLAHANYPSDLPKHMDDLVHSGNILPFLQFLSMHGKGARELEGSIYGHRTVIVNFAYGELKDIHVEYI
jgi:hypothetical protein